MSVDVIVKPKSLLKKKLTLKDILMNCFEYGRYDQNNILIPQEKDDKQILLYHPDHIARGILVDWNEKETYSIHFSILLPTTAEEIDDFYNLVIHVCSLWKTHVFIQDDEEYTIDEIQSLKKEITDFSYSTLEKFLNEHDNGSFFCAMWPIYFRSQDVQHWIEKPSLEAFGNDLHRMQTLDLYYANARYYQTNDQKIMGIYTVTSTVDTIFPLKPMVPFAYINLQNGESIKADNYYVALVSLSNDKMLGLISFDDFMKELSHHELHEFDSEHIYFLGLSEKEIEDIYSKYKI